ncbi:MAG: hypothetical protein SFV23_02550 [Planctomycetaceae bacterium]|nr:hypothetical protein [Planctomycetaceae bacterium]
MNVKPARPLTGWKDHGFLGTLTLLWCAWGWGVNPRPLPAQPPVPPPSASTEGNAAGGETDLPPPIPSPAARPDPARTRSPFSTTDGSNSSSFFRGNRTVAGQSRTRMTPNMIGDFFGSTGQPIFLEPFQGLSLAQLSVNNNLPLATGFVGVDFGNLSPTPTPNGDFFQFKPGQEQLFPAQEYGQLAKTNGDPDSVIDPGPFTATFTGQVVTPPTGPPGVTGAVYSIFGPAIELHPQSPGSGSVVGRSKLAENGSPIPHDRVFLNYSFFDGVPFTPSGISVHRFTPGFEKTFFEGRASYEFRAPFASTLNSNIQDDGSSDGGASEFGNLTNYFKYLVYTDDVWSHSIGLGVTAPTADDVRIVNGSGAALLQIRNDAFHVLPFYGFLWTPTDRWFCQSFFQLDLDANGNRVELSGLDSSGNPTGQFQNIGRVTDATFLYGSLSVGYWLYRDDTATRRLTGLAPMFELHYNRSLQGEDVVRGSVPGTGSYQIGLGAGDVEILNATFGLNAALGRNAVLTAAYVTPLGGGVDQQFDGELRLFANWYFGP